VPPETELGYLEERSRLGTMEMRSNHRVLRPCHDRGDTRGTSGVCSGEKKKEEMCAERGRDNRESFIGRST